MKQADIPPASLPHTHTTGVNLLALALANYRAGEVDTAFDLFLSGCEALAGAETAAPADLAPALATALREAEATLANGAQLSATTAAEEDDFDLAELIDADLLAPAAAGDALAAWQANLRSL